MNVKPWILFMTFFCCFVCTGRAQYVLQVGDRFIPISNGDVVSKKVLLSADTVRVMYLTPGSKELSPMKEVMIKIQENGENTGAYIYPSGAFGKEVRNKIEKMNGGRIIIGQKKPRGETPQGVMAQNKGATITLQLGP